MAWSTTSVTWDVSSEFGSKPGTSNFRHEARHGYVCIYIYIYVYIIAICYIYIYTLYYIHHTIYTLIIVIIIINNNNNNKYIYIYIYLGIVSLRASVLSPFRSSWTRTLLGGLWNVQNSYETCTTSMERAQLLWNVRNFYDLYKFSNTAKSS